MNSLSAIQLNILVASIIGDGEITKIYKNSRRKNHSYREHYGTMQEDYRKWKVSFLNELLYITPASSSVRSASLPLFTKLYPDFYDEFGTKHLPPKTILENCNLPHFLAVIYMDDGSLCISSRINHHKKLIYLTPHVYLYLQCYSKDELIRLKNHIQLVFNIELVISTRKDGQGFILKTTSVKETFNYLRIIDPVTQSCPSMFYKTSWEKRLQLEECKWRSKYPDYTIIASDSERTKPYSNEEINLLIKMKKDGVTTKKIAESLNRSYWSITYKWGELRKNSNE